MHMTEKRKLLLIGLDGATFDLLGPWMEEGHLPNLKRVVERGVSGDLASTVPPTTPPAWSSCVTGKNPGKHGIFDFRESPLLDFKRPLVAGTSVKATKLWNIVNKTGGKVGVMNVPITYPPEEVDGFMISGMMTPGQDADYTRPKELKDELTGAIGEYVVNVDIPKYDVELDEDAMAFLRDIRLSFEKRRDAMFYLMENKPWDFFMAVYILTDRVQHLFWKYIDPREPLADTERGRFIRGEVISAYRIMDDMFGELLDGRMPEGTDLLVMSDHGFGATHDWFNVNTWLMDQGLLTPMPGTLFKKRLFFTGMAMNESAFVKKMVPDAIQGKVRRKIRSGRSTLGSAKSDIESVIDWSRTKAFFASIPAQGIFINIKKEGFPGIVEPGEEYDAIRAEIKKKLLEIKDPRTGEPLVEWVADREEVYSGPRTEFAPDVLFKAGNYGVLGRQLFGARKWTRSSRNVPNGFHRPNGIFIAMGEGIRAGEKIDGASIIDIAPTALHAMGLPVPDDMDGRVLDEIFTDAHKANRSVEYRPADAFEERADRTIYSEEDEESVRDRLKALGYIE